MPDDCLTKNPQTGLPDYTAAMRAFQESFHIVTELHHFGLLMIHFDKMDIVSDPYKYLNTLGHIVSDTVSVPHMLFEHSKFKRLLLVCTAKGMPLCDATEALCRCQAFVNATEVFADTTEAFVDATEAYLMPQRPLSNCLVWWYDRTNSIDENWK